MHFREPFNLIKHKVIQKLACKVNFIRHIGGLIMFFSKFENKIFKISWLECGQCGKNQY